MARRWTPEEEKRYRDQLVELYTEQNKTIKEIGVLLNLNPSSVHKRLLRLGVSVTRERKTGFNNKKSERIIIPIIRTEQLAEFFGIMLGDGHVGHFQTVVTLGTKELEYVEYVGDLMQKLFGTMPRIATRKDGYRDVYIGSVDLTKWLKAEGLVSHKVAAQVDAPKWIFEKREWTRHFLRGFFDTDGSIYRLRFGIQISLTNKSLPLLYSLQRMLRGLEYNPSAISKGMNIYLTRKSDIERFFKEIQPANLKHCRRYEYLTRR